MFCQSEQVWRVNRLFLGGDESLGAGRCTFTTITSQSEEIFRRRTVVDKDDHQMKKILPGNCSPPIFLHQPQTCHHKNCTKLCEPKTFGWQTSLPPVTAMGFPHAPVLCYLLLSLWATAEGGKGRSKEGHCSGPTRERERALRPRTMVAGRDGGSAVARKDDGEDALFFGLMYAHQW